MLGKILYADISNILFFRKQELILNLISIVSEVDYLNSLSFR